MQQYGIGYQPTTSTIIVIMVLHSISENVRKSIFGTPKLFDTITKSPINKNNHFMRPLYNNTEIKIHINHYQPFKNNPAVILKFFARYLGKITVIIQNHR
jgi:hypothetical protein